jgi:hypothetical protein
VSAAFYFALPLQLAPGRSAGASTWVSRQTYRRCKYLIGGIVASLFCALVLLIDGACPCWCRSLGAEARDNRRPA